MQLIYLSSDTILSIPDSICDCKTLNDLSIFGNQINELPVDIEKLTKLKKLDFGRNNISTLRHSISNLLELEYLRLPVNIKISSKIKELEEDGHVFLKPFIRYSTST